MSEGTGSNSVMNLEILHVIFEGTYNQDVALRNEAETKLRELSHKVGFLSTLLELIDNEQADKKVKLAAAISAKNIVANSWMSSLQFNGVARGSDLIISPEEQNLIRNRLIELIIKFTNASFQENTELLALKNNQLLPTLTHIITTDVGQRNDTILNESIGLLSRGRDQNDFGMIYVGLYCLMEVFRTFKWVPNKVRAPRLDPLLDRTFPVINEIGLSLVSYQYSNSYVVDNLHGELVKIILKCFKFVCNYDLPQHIQVKENCFHWVNLHLQIINKELPAYILEMVKSMETDDDLKIKVNSFEWNKAKKWALANLSKIFKNYGTPLANSNSLATSVKDKNYLDFKVFFFNDFVPEILNELFKIIAKVCANEFYLTKPCLNHLMFFLGNSVKINKLWKYYFKDNLKELITNFMYPTLITSNYILKLTEEDPVEFVHLNLNIYDDNGNTSESIDYSTCELIRILVELRPNASLPVILEICHEIFEANMNDDSIEACKKKEAAFKIIDAISHILVDPQNLFYQSVINFLVNFVLPNLFNKYTFLRLKALELMSKFSSIRFNFDENPQVLYKIFQSIYVSLNIENKFTRDISISDFVTLDGERLVIDDDDEQLLPLQIQAALTLQSFLEFEKFRDVISEDVVVIMQKLLNLAKKIDLDVISGVMQEIVEIFSNQLQPFGVELVKSLSSQVLEHLQEFDEVGSAGPEKIMVINGILGTMITILISFENSSDSILNLEEAFAIVLKVVLDKHFDEFYIEVFDLIENSTFLSTSISPLMWEIFNVNIYQNNFKINSDESLILTYLQEFLPTANNFLTYGSAQLQENEVLSNNFFDMLRIILYDGNLPENAKETFDNENLSVFFELSTNFVLSMKLKIVSYVPRLLDLSFYSLFKKTISQLNVKDFNGDVKYYAEDQFFVNMFRDSIISSNRVKIHFLNTIVSCMIYDVHTTLDYMIKYGFFEAFFDLWFENLLPDESGAKKKSPTLKRVFDLKLSTLGILSLLTNLSNEEVTQKYHLNLIDAKINNILTYLVEKLPFAIRNFERKRTEFDDSSFDYNAEDRKLFENQFHMQSNTAENEDDENDDDWLNEEKNYIVNSSAVSNNDVSGVGAGELKKGNYLGFLKLETQQLESQYGGAKGEAVFSEESYYDDDDDDDEDDMFDGGVIEDPLSNNPLDNLDIFKTVNESLHFLQRANQPKYEAFIGTLNETQRALFESILNST